MTNDQATQTGVRANVSLRFMKERVMVMIMLVSRCNVLLKSLLNKVYETQTGKRIGSDRK